jgi:RNA polymerase sigma-70 factor (ECF subfamily)
VNEASDEELYRSMRKGDANALEHLYRRYEPALFRYALHMSGSHFTAEEVAHEVFVQLMAPKQGFQEHRGSLEAYLYGMARNRLRMMQRVRTISALDEFEFPAGRTDALADFIQGESVAALQTALQELPEHYRDVVVLCELEERSYEDTARLLGCPVGTVRSRLSRARALLSAKLKPAKATEALR